MADSFLGSLDLGTIPCGLSTCQRSFQFCDDVSDDCRGCDILCQGDEALEGPTCRSFCLPYYIFTKTAEHMRNATVAAIADAHKQVMTAASSMGDDSHSDYYGIIAGILITTLLIIIFAALTLKLSGCGQHLVKKLFLKQEVLQQRDGHANLPDGAVHYRLPPGEVLGRAHPMNVADVIRDNRNNELVTVNIPAEGSMDTAPRSRTNVAAGEEGDQHQPLLNNDSNGIEIAPDAQSTGSGAASQSGAIQLVRSRQDLQVRDNVPVVHQGRNSLPHTHPRPVSAKSPTEVQVHSPTNTVPVSEDRDRLDSYQQVQDDSGYNTADKRQRQTRSNQQLSHSSDLSYRQNDPESLQRHIHAPCTDGRLGMHRQLPRDTNVSQADSHFCFSMNLVEDCSV